ncbi:DUF2085 domain-containing protein [Halobacteriales archaeon Cl-PHB]
MAIDRGELRRGLAETKRYVFSHHPPSEYDRCYAPVVFGRRVRLCARCSGVYPGIAGGLAAGLGLDGMLTSLVLVLGLPLPALVDWALTAFTDRRGSNPVRTLTGLLLGYAYGLGLVRLLAGGDLRVLAVGLGYGLLAGLLLARQERDASG